jgi:hypothetical protein
MSRVDCVHAFRRIPPKCSLRARSALNDPLEAGGAPEPLESPVECLAEDA